jgi:hypothetical protein
LRTRKITVVSSSSLLFLCVEHSFVVWRWWLPMFRR